MICYRSSRSLLIFKIGVIKYRNSYRRCSVRKRVLRNFAKFTGKHLCQTLGPATLLKKEPWHRYFPWNFAKFLKHLFYRTPLGRCFCCYCFQILKIFMAVFDQNQKLINYFVPLVFQVNC